ncbi:hypothetical protein KTE52_31520 [Burkholderia multivorans]|uniref:Bacteriophage protein n=1 Tax=Burkholderia multivorans TaxID=87883 RepID=A0AAP2HQJ7_9BURK|nr:hypothetical protein [Burkholderia multivorans]
MMALTPEKREVLKLARVKVSEAPRFGHICPILNAVREEHPDLSRAVMEIKAYIVAALDGANTLETWQLRNGFLGYSDIDQCRRDRLAWIDWMLDEPKEA